MNTNNESEIQKALNQLISRIREIVQVRQTEKDFQPKKRKFFQLRVKGFKYGRNGKSSVSWAHEESERESWDEIIASLHTEIGQSEEYKKALTLCKELWRGDWDISNGFRWFVYRPINILLSESHDTCEQLNHVVANYIKELKGEPYPYHTTAHLDGIAVGPDESIEFEVSGLNVKIRQVKPSDIEYEVDASAAPHQALMGGGAPAHRLPSAVLELRGLTLNLRQAKLDVWKAICILRLFRIGSVEIIRSRSKAEQFNDLAWGSEEFTHGYFGGPERYSVSKDNLESLENFWNALWGVIPEEFYWAPGKDTYTPETIAYQRYCDALKPDALVEKRTANAVMGLESLFLGGEKTELSYRLRMRAAKLLGSLAGGANYIQNMIGDAYSVRSVFVHGDQLGSKKRRKLAEKHGGDIAKLTTKTLDCLRQAIVLFIVSKKTKKELINLLDSALIDDKQQAVLHKELAFVVDKCGIIR